MLKRQNRRAEAVEDLSEAKETGDADDIARYTKRVVRVTKEHNEDVRRLLHLMGVPVVEAPGEAEAQCAELVKKNVVWATATEDMDALTFGSSRLLRHMTYSDARKEPILEIELSAVLVGLDLTMDQFVDLCILCGCDYCGSIKGVGPHTALKLIQQHKTLEAAVKHIDTSKHPLPENWHPSEAHELFISAEVTPAADINLEWKDCDADGLIQFLVQEKGFNQERVESGIKKLRAAKGKSAQVRIDSFFTSIPKSNTGEEKKTATMGKEKKRKGEAAGVGKKKGATASSAAAAAKNEGGAAKKMKK